jgi:type IV pilus assembly protein PilB
VTAEQIAAGFQPMEGEGCEVCNDTGYKGRIAFYEVMTFSDELKELVLQGCSTAELKAEAIRLGMQTLRKSGLKKVGEGVTTMKEVLRVTAAD